MKIRDAFIGTFLGFALIAAAFSGMIDLGLRAVHRWQTKGRP